MSTTSSGCCFLLFVNGASASASASTTAAVGSDCDVEDDDEDDDFVNVNDRIKTCLFDNLIWELCFKNA